MQVTRLLSEHAKLRTLGAELVALVSTSEPCDLEELAQRRWNLARVVHMHLAYEERHLFARLEEDPRVEVRLANAKARRGVEHLHASYKRHVERWTAEEIVKGWAEFQGAVKTLVSRMIARIDQEEDNLFPLIARDHGVERKWRPGMRNWAGEGVALQPKISAVTAPVAADALIRPANIL